MPDVGVPPPRLSALVTLPLLGGASATEGVGADRRGSLAAARVARRVRSECEPAAAALNARGARCGASGIGDGGGGIGAEPVRDPLRGIADEIKRAFRGRAG